MSAVGALREAERLVLAGDVAAAERVLAAAWPDVDAAPAPALYLYGLIRRAQKRLPEAERFLRRAIQAEPNAPAHRAALGDLLLSAGLSAQAAARRLISAAPSAEAWEILARALSAQDRLEEALAAIDEAVKLGPHSASAQTARANTLARLGRNEEALAALDALAAQGAAATPGLAFSRGVILFNLARAADAEAVFTAATA